MNKKIRFLVFILFGFLCFPVYSKSAFYIAMDIGNSEFNVDSSYFDGQFNSLSEDEIFESVAFGWQFKEWLVFEGGFEIDAGIDVIEDLFTDSSEEKETSFHGTFIKIATPFKISEKSQITPAVGYMKWLLNVDPGKNSTDIERRGYGIFYELLIDTYATESTSIGIKYRYLNEQYFETSSVGLNISFHF